MDDGPWFTPDAAALEPPATPTPDPRRAGLAATRRAREPRRPTDRARPRTRQGAVRDRRPRPWARRRGPLPLRRLRQRHPLRRRRHRRAPVASTTSTSVAAAESRRRRCSSNRVESVTCRWCGRADAVQVEQSPAGAVVPDTPPDDAIPPPPPAAALLGLPADAWAALLPTVRAALHDVDDRDATPALRRLRAAPTGRLAGGRVRQEVCSLLAQGGAPWEALYRRLMADEVARTWPRRCGVSRCPHRRPPPRPRRRHRRERAPTRAIWRGPANGCASPARNATRCVDGSTGAESRAKPPRRPPPPRRPRSPTLAPSWRTCGPGWPAAAERERAVARERRRASPPRPARRRVGATATHRGASAGVEQRRNRNAAGQAGRGARTPVGDDASSSARPPRAVPGRPSTLPPGARRVATGDRPAAARRPPGARRRLQPDPAAPGPPRSRDPAHLARATARRPRRCSGASVRSRSSTVERASVARPALASREVEVRFTPAGITPTTRWCWRWRRPTNRSGRHRRPRTAGSRPRVGCRRERHGRVPRSPRMTAGVGS